MSAAFRIHGLQAMNRAFARADKNLKRELRNTLKDVAEPVRADAERRALRDIKNIGPRWSQMRTSVKTYVTYVAPKRRGQTGSKRPNLAPMLMDRAMQPALDSHTNDIEQALGHMLDEIGREWARGG